ncbi:hypothetical protein BE221DRAFT_80633 [Ostreococcus tauri]|uniref:Glycerophosphodiester phosphodiesterase n=1 Tax=Ostreococcus tauri TaxID=70448 RepID=A0A1Y5I1G9_OSTTA|nr:hypothetical protein BE221DRAFT_80633 [Ostreococcus tauri]
MGGGRRRRRRRSRRSRERRRGSSGGVRGDRCRGARGWGESWRAKRTAFERLLRGRRPVVEFAWAARDVEDFAVNVSNVDARRMRKIGGARVAFPSIKMTRAWFAEASRQKIDVIPWIVDDEESARKALSVGAKAVISNVPLRMRRILDEMCKERWRGKF